MSTKVKVGIVVVLVGVAFAGGRYLTPTKLKIETKTVEVIKTVVVKEKGVDKETHRETTIVETTNKDGTKTITTTVVEDSHIQKDTKVVINEDKEKEESDKREVTKTSSRLNISALAGVPVSLHGIGSPEFGAHISKDIIGPISIGAWGLSSGVFGLSCGLTL